MVPDISGTGYVFRLGAEVSGCLDLLAKWFGKPDLSDLFFHERTTET